MQIDIPWRKLGVGKVMPVGFEPTPFRNGAFSHRLRPLGQSVLDAMSLVALEMAS